MSEYEFDPAGEEPQRKAVFISLAEPVALRVEALADDRAPEGSALGTFIGDRLVARCAMPREAIDRLLDLDLFSEPVPLALLAFEEEPGVQCRLFALVPTERLSADERDDEPWRASVPSYEDALEAAEDEDDEDEDEEDDEDDEEDDDPSVQTILLGNIVRFARDRKHPEDLATEAVDVLQKVIGGGTLRDASSKAIDDLLDSL